MMILTSSGSIRPRQDIYHVPQNLQENRPEGLFVNLGYRVSLTVQLFGK